MYNSLAHKEHLMAIARACYDNQDMLWQEDYFELFDEHIAPLRQEVKPNGMPTDKANAKYQEMNELLRRNDDCWVQDDWYDFCDATFELVLEIAAREGWDDELSEQFPYVYEAR